LSRIVAGLNNYKTSDGKPQNSLTSDEPTSPAEAVRIIDEVSAFYQKLVSGETPSPEGYQLPVR
jgi:hypothetical protein